VISDTGPGWCTVDTHHYRRLPNPSRDHATERSRCSQRQSGSALLPTSVAAPQSAAAVGCTKAEPGRSGPSCADWLSTVLTLNPAEVSGEGTTLNLVLPENGKRNMSTRILSLVIVLESLGRRDGRRSHQHLVVTLLSLVAHIAVSFCHRFPEIGISRALASSRSWGRSPGRYWQARRERRRQGAGSRDGLSFRGDGLSIQCCKRAYHLGGHLVGLRRFLSHLCSTRVKRTRRCSLMLIRSSFEELSGLTYLLVTLMPERDSECPTSSIRRSGLKQNRSADID
jgi:hypothetical protein